MLFGFLLTLLLSLLDPSINQVRPFEPNGTGNGRRDSRQISGNGRLEGHRLRLQCRELILGRCRCGLGVGQLPDASEYAWVSAVSLSIACGIAAGNTVAGAGATGGTCQRLQIFMIIGDIDNARTLPASAWPAL